MRSFVPDHKVDGIGAVRTRGVAAEKLQDFMTAALCSQQNWLFLRFVRVVWIHALFQQDFDELWSVELDSSLHQGLTVVFKGTGGQQKRMPIFFLFLKNY